MKKMTATIRLYLSAIFLLMHDKLFGFMASQGLVLHANTLTGLIPDLYEALDVVSREMIGFIPAVHIDASAERAAVGENIVIPIVPATGASVAITPGVTAPNTGDQQVGNTIMTISKSQMVPIRWNGVEQKQLTNAGIYQSVDQQRFSQAIRTLANEVELDLAVAAALGASRAYGAAATVPFGVAADLSDNAQMLKILEDNGAPQGDLHAVLGSGAIANIRGKQSVLFKVNEAGTDQLLRKGVIGEMQGAMVHNSAGIKPVTAGTNAAGTTNAAGYAIGATVITLASASTGTIIPGDVISFAGDTLNKYVVVSGDASVADGGSITIQEPGLQKAIPASATVITTIATCPRNIYFPRSSIALIARSPEMPEGGDMADDVIYLTDPVSGLTFQVAMYRQYRQVHIEVALAWGVKAVMPRHIAALLG